MKKKLKNMKGFAMAELLAVSLVILVLFSVLFSNYLPLVAEYENRIMYNDVSAQYAAYYVSQIVNEAIAQEKFTSYKTSIKEKGYVTLYGGDDAENKNTKNKLALLAASLVYDGAQATCNQLIATYDIQEVIVTPYKLTDLKDRKGYGQSDGSLYKYIQYLPSYKNSNADDDIYRIILKTGDGHYATIKTVPKSKDEDVCGSNKPNAPVLDDAMIPVYYDEDSETWKKADSTNKGNNWYDYCEKKWANSVTVSSTNRETYKNASVGTEILMDDILTMQVWIPRYKYKVWNYNADALKSSKEQEIEIIFENGTESTGEITCTDNIQGSDGDGTSEICNLDDKVCTNSTCNKTTYTHPAFTFGDAGIKGFWIGKFELTGTISNITVKPDLSSVKDQTVSSFETNIMNMKNSGNSYGLSPTTDTHMIKNMEWGAVAYLSHSKYGTCTDGTCTEVNINNSSGYYTGRSGGAPGGSTAINTVYTAQTSTEQYNTYGFYTYDGYLLDYDTNTKSGTKDISKVASTTNNIYGVYDMSGGAHEYTMGNTVSADGKTMLTVRSDFDTYPAEKYYDKYSYGDGDTSRTRSKLGDGIKEVHIGVYYGWYSDEHCLAYSSRPWFLRGGYSKSEEEAGVFSSYEHYGNSESIVSSRPVITP